MAISASDTLDALRVGAAVEAALDGEAGAGGGAGDQLDDHLVGEQGLAAPVLGDEGEQPMLDPVPPDAVIRAQALTGSLAPRQNRSPCRPHPQRVRLVRAFSFHDNSAHARANGRFYAFLLLCTRGWLWCAYLETRSGWILRRS